MLLKPVVLMPEREVAAGRVVRAGGVGVERVDAGGRVVVAGGVGARARSAPLAVL